MHLLLSRKALKSWTEASAPHDEQQPFAKMCAWLLISPSLKLYITLTFLTTHLEEFLRAIWEALSQAIVLICFQIKFNSQLSSCACMFFSPYYIKKSLVTSLISYPKPKLCLDTSLIVYPKPKFPCLANSSQSYLFIYLSEKYKYCLLWATS